MSLTSDLAVNVSAAHASRIALLEDDAELRERILIPGLTDFGFDVTGTGTAAELYRHMLTQSFDIVVLDIGLPDEDGLTVARNLRAISNIGIVMLTGNHAKRDRMNALTHGADVYMAKPADIDVLAATLHSLQRRLGTPAATSGQQATTTKAASQTNPSPWQLDRNGWCLTAPNGVVLALTAPERRLLMTLIEAHGQPVPREELIAALCSDVYNFDPHRLEMLVHRLRRKAVDMDIGPLPLLTSRGKGYLFVPLP